MPHYGVEAKVGDEVECPGHYSKIRHGIVTAIYLGAESCNLAVAHLQKLSPHGNPEALVVGAGLATCTAKECKKLP